MAIDTAPGTATLPALALVQHLYFSELENESRMIREARVAREAGLVDRTEWFGHVSWRFPDREVVEGFITVKRVGRLSTSRWGRLFNWPRWTAAVVGEIRRAKPDLIQAHSLAAMPAGVIGKYFTGARLIYDAHELETERNGWNGAMRAMARLAERLVIRRADHVLVVGPMIGEWYRTRYRRVKLSVLRNVPELTPDAASNSSGDLRSRLGLASNAQIGVYVGVIGANRGIELMLEVFSTSATDKHLAIVGYGPLESLVQSYAAAHPNIHFVEAVPNSEVTSFIKTADFALLVADSPALSYQYALSNKLLQYATAALPVVVADLPETGHYVRSHKCGWVVAPTFDNLSATLARLTPEALARVRSQTLPPPRWDEEKTIYLNVLRDLS